MLATYAHKYHSLKAPRILEWKPSLGSVTLELTIGDRQLEFTVSPFHATVLLQFQAHPEWSQAALAVAVGAPPEMLRRKIVYWVNQGVLSERRAGDGAIVYCRNEQLQSGGGAGDGEAGMDVEDGGAGQAEALEMARLDPFILGMLTNFDALPLDRIHNMLKMFASDPPYDKTLEQLGAYMSRLVADDKVMVAGGVYKKRT
jgi:anaphase-promoting complex subunit 2